MTERFNRPFWRRCAKILLIRFCLAPLLLCGLAIGGGAAAQGLHHPFAVGANEGAFGPPSGLAGWLLAQESSFYLLLTGAIRLAKQNSFAGAGLMGLSFGYGVFHAAGPGHGKAVIASYMLANEKTLRRGLLIALGAALLQGLAAIALVGIAAIALRATAQTMTQAAHAIEMASYGGMVLLGLGLSASKGGKLLAVLRHFPSWRANRQAETQIANLAFSLPGGRAVAASPFMASGEAQNTRVPALFSSEAGTASREENAEKQRPGAIFRSHPTGNGSSPPAQRTASLPRSGFSTLFAANRQAGCASCGHSHMPDGKTLAGNFSWNTALLSMVSAGARPCSGAILVLVFALSQDIFTAGLASVLAMSLGTALTTGALACFAVYAKKSAMKRLAASRAAGSLFGPVIEFAAALAVLVFGGSMLFASFNGRFFAG